MNTKILLMAVFFLMLFFLNACTPGTVEPEADRIPTRLPHATPPEPTPPPTPQFTSPETAPTFPLPLAPENVPATLPVYLMARESIPADSQSAAVWADRFGLKDYEILEENEELLILLALDETGNYYQELTFIRTPFNESIVYSTGIYWQNFSGPTPTPDTNIPAILPQEMVIDTALSFVRQHNLVPEPMVAHELPNFDAGYVVHVSFAPEGLRLTGIGLEPGVRVRIDSNGRFVEARIVPASFAKSETIPISPIDQVYASYLQGSLPNTMFNERSQNGTLRLDPMRFQAHSSPYGDQGDRVELVYAPLPTQPERVVPMWLITRPHEDSWNHYDEYYLAATAAENLPRPIPSPTPLAQTGIMPEALEITPPLIVESVDGLLFTNAVVDGITHTVSLNAETGDLSAVFGLTGGLALDDGRNQLYVDKHPLGLTVIDTATGQVVNEIQIPAGERNYAQIQADPVTGNVLLFRDQMVLVADPLSPTWQQTIPISVDGTVCDEPMDQPPVIDQTWIDGEARLLYLSLIDYVCTPWISYTMVIYNLDTMSEVARYPRLDSMSGLAVNGRFYGKSWFRLGKTFQWTWQDGQPWLEQTEREADIVGAYSGFQVDQNRGRLYELTANGLQILDMETMVVVKVMSAPVNGRLAGFDPVTDNLYFVEEESGRLVVWSAENIQN